MVSRHPLFAFLESPTHGKPDDPQPTAYRMNRRDPQSDGVGHPTLDPVKSTLGRLRSVSVLNPRSNIQNPERSELP
jgi:hypothetical protein